MPVRSNALPRCRLLNKQVLDIWHRRSLITASAPGAGQISSSMTLLALATAQLAFQAPATSRTLSKVAEAAAPLIVAGVLATTTGAVPAFADGNPSAGERIFSGNCAACHAGGQNVIMPEKTLERQARACTLAPPRMRVSLELRQTRRPISSSHTAPPPPTPKALEEFLDGGFSEAAVVKQVTNGKNAMPAFGSRLCRKRPMRPTSAAESADWPRLVGARGSPWHALALTEASEEPAALIST